MTINVEVIEENAHKAADILRSEGFDITVTKRDVMSPEIMDKYGIMMTPGIAVNGVLKLQGKLPDKGVIERLIRETI